MKKYGRHNFFKHTFCEFREVESELVNGREPNYKSDTGSLYFFDEEGLFRYSNHWGRVANCRWVLLRNKTDNSIYKWAYAAWSDFYPNNEDEKLFFVKVDFDNGKVQYQHKYSSDNSEAVIYRTANETAKLIKQIKEILESDSWAKYLDIEDISVTRRKIIEELINTKKNLMQIKREL